MMSSLISTLALAAPAETGANTSLLEDLIGIDIPDFALWIALGVVVLVVLAFIAKGFFAELKKK